MILLDASAVLAFTRDEPAADQVEALLGDPTRTAISAINLAEVVDRLVRRFGVNPDDAIRGLRLIRASGLDVLFVDDLIAEGAGALRARRYRRREQALSMADCVALATARQERAPLATADRTLIEVAPAENVEVISLLQ